MESFKDIFYLKFLIFSLKTPFTGAARRLGQNDACVICDVCVRPFAGMIFFHKNLMSN